MTPNLGGAPLKATPNIVITLFGNVTHRHRTQSLYQCYFHRLIFGRSAWVGQLGYERNLVIAILGVHAVLERHTGMLRQTMVGSRRIMDSD